MRSESGKEDNLGLERVVFFSDAVFAIAVTLLILEVGAPHLPEGARNRGLIKAVVGLGFALIPAVAWLFDRIGRKRALTA